MNVLFWFWGRTAGGARYSLEVARALANVPSVNLTLSLSRQSAYFEEFVALNLSGCHVDTYESFSEMVLQARHLPRYRRQLKEFILAHKIDVVYAPMTHIWNAAVVSLFRKLGIKYVLTMHDAITHAGDMEWIKNRLLRRDVLASDACITLTQAVKQQVRKIYEYPFERIAVIPHGAFQYGKFCPRELPRGRPIRLLFYGRILKYKGLGLLLDALKRLPNVDPNLKLELQIWGDGALAPYVNDIELLRSHGMAVRVQNRWVAEREIETIFRETDICVLPYVEASQSGVAAIAFATAMPIVATPQPGLIEQLEKGGGIVSSACDAEAFTHEIVKIASAPALYEHLSKSALRQAEEELSWKKIGNDIASFLKLVTT